MEKPVSIATRYKYKQQQKYRPGVVFSVNCVIDLPLNGSVALYYTKILLMLKIIHQNVSFCHYFFKKSHC